MADLNIAEICRPDGAIQFRYARRMSADRTRWIRHGLFIAYHPDGKLASEGTYVDGQEHGLWTDYHANGQVAAKGQYENGEKVGDWEFWNDDGLPASE